MIRRPARTTRPDTRVAYTTLCPSRGIAIPAVDRSLAGDAGVSPDTRSVAVSETSEAITVAVAFTVPAGDFLRSAFVPSSSHILRPRATFELPEYYADAAAFSLPGHARRPQHADRLRPDDDDRIGGAPGRYHHAPSPIRKSLVIGQ